MGGEDRRNKVWSPGGGEIGGIGGREKMWNKLTWTTRRTTHWRFPASTALWSGTIALWFTAFGCAPFSRRYEAPSTWPNAAEKCSWKGIKPQQIEKYWEGITTAVFPIALCVSISAPLSIASFISGRLPAFAAMCKTVSPLSVAEFTSAPPSRRC